MAAELRFPTAENLRFRFLSYDFILSCEGFDLRARLVGTFVSFTSFICFSLDNAGARLSLPFHSLQLCLSLRFH